MAHAIRKSIESEAAGMQRSLQTAFVATLAVVGMAVLYFGVIYLMAR